VFVVFVAFDSAGGRLGTVGGVEGTCSAPAVLIDNVGEDAAAVVIVGAVPLSQGFGGETIVV